VTAITVGQNQRLHSGASIQHLHLALL
jgi:hypothetical protein